MRGERQNARETEAGDAPGMLSRAGVVKGVGTAHAGRARRVVVGLGRAEPGVSEWSRPAARALR